MYTFLVTMIDGKTVQTFADTMIEAIETAVLLRDVQPVKCEIISNL